MFRAFRICHNFKSQFEAISEQTSPEVGQSEVIAFQKPYQSYVEWAITQIPPVSRAIRDPVLRPSVLNPSDMKSGYRGSSLFSINFLSRIFGRNQIKLDLFTRFSSSYGSRRKY